MAVRVHTATTPGWPSGEAPHGSTGEAVGFYLQVIYPPQDDAQRRVLRELIEWSISEGGLDKDLLAHLDHEAWGIDPD
jgi:hypothetical protein